MLDIDMDGFVSYSDFKGGLKGDQPSPYLSFCVCVGWLVGSADHSNAQFLEEQAGGLAVTEI